MDIIKQNPYRILGLFANSSERELQKQIAVIKRFAEVGKSKSFDYDFDFLGEVSRGAEDVQVSASKIEQAHKKVHYALFWFVNSSNFDEIALNSLKDSDKGKAIDIWNKTLRNEVSEKNYSSYQNLSSLYISSSVSGEKLDLEMMRMGVELKGVLLESNFLGLFVDLIGGGSIAGREEISEIFVDDIIDIVDPLLGSNKHVKNKRIIGIFDGYPNHVKKYVVKKFTEEPFQNIEGEIDKTEGKRTKNPADSYVIGMNLFSATADDVVLLKSMLGSGDVQLQVMIDRLADELMQCSIDYFNEWRDSETKDPGWEALRVAESAKSLVPKGRVKNRIEKNAEVIQEWVDNKPERERQAKVSSTVSLVTSLIDEFDEVAASRVAIDRFILGSRPKLREIRTVLGDKDEFYLQISSAIVARVLGGLIGIHNHGQERVIKRISSLDEFTGALDWIVATIDKIQLFDMTSDVRSRLEKNKKVIVGTKTQVDVAATKSSGGCYIATMAYGDYDHPQVLLLREYRDQVLSRNITGRLFIKFYYATSPTLVNILNNKKPINSAIRRLLDKWIQVIKI